MFIIIALLILVIIIVMITPLKNRVFPLLIKLSVEGENEKRNKKAKEYVKIGLVITLIPFVFSWIDFILVRVNHSNDVMGMGKFISDIVVITFSICLAAVLSTFYLRNSIVKIVIITLALIPSLLLALLIVI